MATVPADLQAQAHFAAGALAYGQTDHVGARDHWERSVALARAAGDQAGVAASLNGLGLLFEQGQYKPARSWRRAARSTARWATPCI